MVHVCPKTAEEAKPPVTRESVLSLHEITEDNWRAVIQLKTKPEQAGNLASNAVSIVEGHYSEDAWFRAIYADNHTVVGFLMLAIWDPTEMYYIWRFMIDQRYQGLGFGKQGVALAVAKIREHAPKAKLIRVMSTAPEGQTVEGRPEKTVKPEDSPYHFYTKLGFREISGPDEDGEHELAMEL
jgi:diamine N-acetyltransferase